MKTIFLLILSSVMFVGVGEAQVDPGSGGQNENALFSEVQECRVLAEQINKVRDPEERQFFTNLIIEHVILHFFSANGEGTPDFVEICTKVLSIIPVSTRPWEIPVSTRPWDEDPRPKDNDHPILNYNQNEECKCNPSSVPVGQKQPLIKGREVGEEIHITY